MRVERRAPEAVADVLHRLPPRVQLGHHPVLGKVEEEKQSRAGGSHDSSARPMRRRLSDGVIRRRYHERVPAHGGAQALEGVGGAELGDDPVVAVPVDDGAVEVEHHHHAGGRRGRHQRRAADGRMVNGEG